MALFSDVDWLVLLAVGAVLLLGPGSASTVRQLGRYYSRLLRFKQEMLGELAKAADLPPPAPGQSLSLRQSLFDLNEGPRRPAGIPAPVTRAPVVPSAPMVPAAASAPIGPASLGPAMWATSSPTLEPTRGFSP